MPYVADLREAAKMRAHRMVFDYVDAGADDEITLRRNKDAYSQLELHYHVLAVRAVQARPPA